MVIKAKKWGNSLAIRIPNYVVKEIGLKDGTLLDLKIERNKIIISLIKKRKKGKYKLDDLLSKITPKNRYGEIDFGPPIGKKLI